jgi:hypothetical protein
VTGQPTTPLRDQLADAIRNATCTGNCDTNEEQCARERIQPFAWHHGKLAVVEGSPEMFSDAVLTLFTNELAKELKADWARYRGRVLQEAWEALRDAEGGPLIDGMNVINKLLEKK